MSRKRSTVDLDKVLDRIDTLERLYDVKTEVRTVEAAAAAQQQAEREFRTPEERYQERKKHWYFHPSSYYMRDWEKGYDGKCCNTFTGCVPECRYYAKEGRITKEEIEAEFNKYFRKKLEKQRKQQQQQEQQQP